MGTCEMKRGKVDASNCSTKSLSDFTAKRRVSPSVSSLAKSCFTSGLKYRAPSSSLISFNFFPQPESYA